MHVCGDLKVLLQVVYALYISAERDAIFMKCNFSTRDLVKVLNSL